MTLPFYLLIGLLVPAAFLLAGCSVNGHAMRAAPGTATAALPKAKSSYIAGLPDKAPDVSCSFVEFDERGDFLDFNQHRDCEQRIETLAASNKVVVVLYCHGWKTRTIGSSVVGRSSSAVTTTSGPLPRWKCTPESFGPWSPATGKPRPVQPPKRV